ncbi:DUF4292 domain-containing protein [Aggregicoccus sp. 17bor-14]|uniref:DUF4292 domain-containing protein n=1 Tax=Myxococcaceae TaxID=31 RepID=UPI00129D0682|nr:MULTISPECIES: DUF4292 domain-containing protein [Myxococcaceae]MBF5045543.1 DUF4292 domain-containing protein [Simulacricoccus sp. 17bor-14]MRI91280.1 DUF4292 domain-containing protein [Aggregicoccus sp. 17bor-14]
MNRVAAAMFLTLLCTGCPKRLDFGPEGEVKDPAALLALVRQAEARVATLQGESRLRVESPDAKGTVTLYGAIARPGMLHLETLDFFGKPLAVLVSDGQRFGLYQAQENRYYRGPATPENLSRFLPVVIPGDELVSLLLGEAPRIAEQPVSLRVDAKAGGYVLTLEGEVPSRSGAPTKVTQVLTVHPTHYRVLHSEVHGMDAYELGFGDFLQSGKLSFPRTAKLQAPQAQTTLELRYTDVTLNGPPDLTMFELAAPEGVPVVEVDGQGRPLPQAPLAPPGS